MKKIGIIGCGWLGSYIADFFSDKNKIYTTTTSHQKNNNFISMGYNSFAIEFWDYEILEKYKSWSAINDLDIIIITVPFSKRNSSKLLNNRFGNISLFINNFKGQLFLMSSIGIYPQVEMEISENTLDKIYLNPSILFVEELIKMKFPQVNILRLGGLMGGSRIFSNYKTSSPNKIVNHIHYKDIILVINKMIINKNRSKTYNVVAPTHPTKQEIINYQQDINKVLSIKKNGRKIISNLLIKELNYDFSYPNPTYF